MVIDWQLMNGDRIIDHRADPLLRKLRLNLIAPSTLYPDRELMIDMPSIELLGREKDPRNFIQQFPVCICRSSAGFIPFFNIRELHS
ncbi:hypothetical protein D3C71_1851320 [compost metagenome]